MTLFKIYCIIKMIYYGKLTPLSSALQMNAPKRQVNNLSAVQPRNTGVAMSIFNLSKEPPELSHDWNVFQQFMGNIGAFTYIAKSKTAYLDDVACRMLSCSGNKLNEFEFFNLLEKICFLLC